jgi:UDP-N-acetylmuramate--alanine ligase
MKIYFIGIGGIGVSALAQYYLAKGNQIFGSDAYDSEIIRMLQKKGVEIFIGPQKQENIKENYDLVIFSPAVKEDNPELTEARKKGLKCLSYPEALGELTKEYFTIAITGTHGKSTTTAMVALILIKAGLDPTVIVGTKLKEFNDSNFRMGQSQYLVIEACEHEASFLKYYPRIAIITNIEEDHLDYYKNFANIQKAFDTFALQVSPNGFIIKNKKSELKAKTEIIDFSLENLDDVRKIKTILKIPGEHNILNGLAALSLARLLGISDEIALSALSEFYGSWRRFEITTLSNFILIDDYAHHPTEIAATLKSTREKFPDKKICCVFQPHQYQRTQFLWFDFISVFQLALVEKMINSLILIDVYDVIGREGGEIKEKFNSKIMAEKIANDCVYLEDKKNLEGYFADSQIIIMMGAGNIYDLSSLIKSKYLGSCPNE